jgi:hypothetical protein
MRDITVNDFSFKTNVNNSTIKEKYDSTQIMEKKGTPHTEDVVTITGQGNEVCVTAKGLQFPYKSNQVKQEFKIEDKGVDFDLTGGVTTDGTLVITDPSALRGNPSPYEIGPAWKRKFPVIENTSIEIPGLLNEYKSFNGQINQILSSLSGISCFMMTQWADSNAITLTVRHQKSETEREMINTQFTFKDGKMETKEMQ